jgi:hypothetical protein
MWTELPHADAPAMTARADRAAMKRFTGQPACTCCCALFAGLQTSLNVGSRLSNRAVTASA